MSLPVQADPVLHPRVIRITHWVNAIAMLIMIMSGWQIYNAAPIFPFLFPQSITIGGWLGGALLWHFAAMWVLMVNFALYCAYGVISGRFRSKLWPIRGAELIADLRSALAGRLVHEDLSTYNAVQRLLYAGVIGAIALAILTGFALWKPVQLQALTALFGGFQGARLVHFFAMAAITGFLLVHVAMALVVPKTLRAMTRGQ